MLANLPTDYQEGGGVVIILTTPLFSAGQAGREPFASSAG
jgi:hypothetical protein